MFHFKRGSGKDIRLAVSLSALIAVAATSLAQNRRADSAPKKETGDEPHDMQNSGVKLRRLETVTWNPVTDELTWVVSAGHKAAGVYSPVATETYLIQLDSALMKLKGEGRTFSKDEAESVHMLVDLIARYAVESTVWWEEGLGDKVDEKGNPAPGQRKEGDDNKSRRSLRHSPLPIADGDRQRPSDNPANPWLLKVLQTRIAEIGARPMESGGNRSSQ